MLLDLSRDCPGSLHRPGQAVRCRQDVDRRGVGQDRRSDDKREDSKRICVDWVHLSLISSKDFAGNAKHHQNYRNSSLRNASSPRRSGTIVATAPTIIAAPVPTTSHI